MYNATPCSICVHMFMCACACMHVYVCVCVNRGIMIDWQWERQHHPKQVEKPYIPGLRAVNLSADYKLKHAARSHHCFSKYFQSWCLEIIALGQGRDWFPKHGLCVLWLSGFIEGLKNENRLHLLLRTWSQYPSSFVGALEQKLSILGNMLICFLWK